MIGRHTLKQKHHSDEGTDIKLQQEVYTAVSHWINRKLDFVELSYEDAEYFEFTVPWRLKRKFESASQAESIIQRILEGVCMARYGHHYNSRRINLYPAKSFYRYRLTLSVGL